MTGEKRRVRIGFPFSHCYQIIDRNLASVLWDIPANLSKDVEHPLYRDEGWNLNPDEEKFESDEKQPHISDGVLLEVSNSNLKRHIKRHCPQLIHHFQIIGINFGLDVISEKLPLVIKE